MARPGFVDHVGCGWFGVVARVGALALAPLVLAVYFFESVSMGSTSDPLERQSLLGAPSFHFHRALPTALFSNIGVLPKVRRPSCV